MARPGPRTTGEPGREAGTGRIPPAREAGTGRILPAREAGPGRVLLVRHGQSEGNRLRQFSRDNDIDLTEKGVEQAREAGGRIRGRFRPGRIIASPYHRTQRTARLIAETLGHPGPIESEPALREREIGELAGAPYSAMVQHPDYEVERFWEWRPPGGESLVDVVGRAAPVLEELLRKEEEVVVVSHGGVILALRAHLEGGWYHRRVTANCEILVVERDGGGDLRVRSLDGDRTAGGSTGAEGTG